jgi:hypothetical protein
MVGKHANLETNRLILVSEAGFTDQARELAEREFAVPLAPVDVEGPDGESHVLWGLRSLWPKEVTFTPERFKARVKPTEDQEAWFEVPADVNLFTEDGTPRFNLNQWWVVWARNRFEGIADQIGLRDIAEDRDAWFVLEAEGPHAKLDGQRVAVYLRADDRDPPELHEVTSIEVVGKADIKVREVQLRHRRLGEMEFAQGEFQLGQQRMLVVATGDVDARALTVRPLPAEKAEKRQGHTKPAGAR